MTEIVSLINPDIQIVERIVYVVRYCPSEAQRRAIKKYQEKNIDKIREKNKIYSREKLNKMSPDQKEKRRVMIYNNYLKVKDTEEYKAYHKLKYQKQKEKLLHIQTSNDKTQE